MTVTAGVIGDGFESVRDVFEQILASGEDVGASVAVAVDGKLVVDLWGGYMDDKRLEAWEKDTIVNVFSSTKTMAALCVLVLADRRDLDLHAPVARYWPEFAANGKSSIEVRHVLGHTAGLSGWEEPMSQEDLYDWDVATSRLAAQAPWWEPGTASGYHATTQGYLLGEIVRRVTGVTIGRFFAKEIAEPLGADFHIGLAAEHDHRVARLVPPDALPMEVVPGSILERTVTNPPIEADWAATDGWRRAEIPAANGHGNARSMAQIQSILACGGEVSGIRFLSRDGWARVFEVQSDGVDLVLGMPVRFGMGYAVSSEGMPFQAGPHAFFWGGWGGSLIVNDPDERLTFAYAMNRMGQGTVGDQRSGSLLAAVYHSLQTN